MNRMPDGVQVIVALLVGMAVLGGLALFLLSLGLVAVLNMDNPHPPNLIVVCGFALFIAVAPNAAVVLVARALSSGDGRGRLAAQLLLFLLGASLLAAVFQAGAGSVSRELALVLLPVPLLCLVSALYLELPSVRRAYGLEPVGILGRHPIAVVALVGVLVIGVVYASLL